MIIKRLHIDNFGCLSNQDISFGKGLNQLFNENGWGKTTLSIFIKAMFYGMPPARENIKMDRKKYMPWQGGNFGGWLEFSCGQGEFRIVRKFAKTPEGDECQMIDLTTNQVCQMPKEGLGEWLFGVGRETFEMTAFLPQSNFMAVANEQISAGVLGLDKFKYDLASVGNALSNIKKEISQLKKNLVKQIDIDRQKKQIADLQADLIEAESALKQIDVQYENERANYSNLEDKFAKEQSNFKTHENIYTAKLKLENQLKEENEKLASLLIKQSNIKQEKPPSKRKPNAIVLIIGAIIALAGVILGSTSILNWLIAGVIVAIGAGIVVIGMFSGKKIEREKDSVTTSDVLAKECQNNIHQLKSTLQNYQGIEAPNNEMLNYQQNLMFGSKLALERLSTQRKNLLEQKERLLQEIATLQDMCYSKDQINQSVNDKIEILQLTQDFLTKAKENVSERFVLPMNKGLSTLLERFDMRGRSYVVDTNFDIKQVTDGGIKEFENSSQGYKDILSFCMRLLLVQEVYKKEKPCVILDDSLVNFDDINFAKAKNFINDFSKDMQVLYICCSESKRI